ncbi:3-oxoacyl-ACP synthase III family protein [Pseudoalteromonas rhizosphaerae]|uniref:3-oxoacyl-ACP synthase III family protein n=1 Tax=Pseudoalteromonas rhizosphaerae TaxID=2518973 RepID=A0ABW8L1Q4_9GAMM
MNSCGVTISAIAARVPTIKAKNFDSVWFSEISKEDQQAWQDKWGITQRFYTDYKLHSPLELACDVASEVLQLANLEAAEIDMLITSSTNALQLAKNADCDLHDKLFYPRISYSIKQQLSAHNAIEFDIQNECSSMMDAMQIGHNAIKTGQAKIVLLVVQEAVNEVMDRTTVNGMNFGDGYAAIILSRHSNPNLGIQSQAYQSISKNYSLATVRWDSESSTLSGTSFQMPEAGASEMGKFVPKTLPKLVKLAMAKVDMDPSDVDFFVFHQPARMLIDAWCKLLSIPEDKTIKIMQQYGCAVSAAMPIAFNLALQQKKIQSNCKIVIASPSVGWGFGAQIWQLGELPKFSSEIHQSEIEKQRIARNEI